MYINLMIEENKNVYVSYWLLLISILVGLMIVLGGLTRLTDSGLSITKWDLFIGILPPLSFEDWDKSFKGSNLFYSIMMINLFDSILSNIPKQKIGLYLYENQAWEKCLISSWNKFKHGKLIGVAHSTVRFWDLRYFKSKKILRNPISMKNEFPNNIAVNGTLASSALLKGGYDKKLLLKTEALRFLYLNKYLENKNNNKRKKIKNILLIGDIDKKKYYRTYQIN